MKGNDFICDCVNLMHHKCNNMNLYHDEWYIDSPDWMKNNKTKINLINDDYNCFQYAATFALNYEEIGKIYKENQNLCLW